MKKIINYKKAVLLIILIFWLIPFGGCKKEIKLKINSIPSEATLYIDSQNIGKTSIEVNLNPGEHHIEIEKVNYITLREKIKVFPFGKKNWSFELKRISTLFSKKIDGDISIIKVFEDRVYLVINGSRVFILDSKDGDLISMVDLSEIDTKNLPCKESIEKVIKIDKNKNYSPKEIINLYLKTKAYLLSSNCLKVFEKRESEVKERLKVLFFDQKLVEKELTKLREDFLEISWVDDISNFSEFKSFSRFYGEYEKKELACFYVEDLVLKKFEVEEIDFPFKEIPLEWIVIGRHIPGVWLSSIQKYDTILLKKVDNRWFIIDINGGCKGIEEPPEETDSLFCLPPLKDFPNPPKIKDMISLPSDIERDFERSLKATSKQGDCLKIRDIKVFNERVFIQTNCDLLVFDAKLNLISKYLSYFPLNSSFAIGTTFVSKESNKFNISYFDLNNEDVIWSRDFNTDPLFFLTSDDNYLYYLQINKDLLYLIEVDSKSGNVLSKKEILKVDESYKNINLIDQIFILPKNKFLFFKNNVILLFDLKGNILWKTVLNNSIISLFSNDEYVGISSSESVLILDSNDGKLLKKIKLNSAPKKIYIFEDFLFYIDDFGSFYNLFCLDLKKEKRMFILKTYNENFIITKEGFLLFIGDKKELSSINLNLILKE